MGLRLLFTQLNFFILRKTKFIPTRIKNTLCMAIVLEMSIMNILGQSVQPSAQKNMKKDVLSVLKTDSLIVLRKQQKKLDSLSQLASNTIGKSQERLNNHKEKIRNKQEAASDKVDNFIEKVHDKLPVNPTLGQSSLVSDKLEEINRSTEKLYTITPKTDVLKEKAGDLNLSGVEKLEELRLLKDAKLSKSSKSLENFEYLSKVKEDISKLKDGHLDKTGIEQALKQKMQSLEGVADLEVKKSAVAPRLEEYNHLSDPLDEFGGMEKLKDSDAIGKETVNHIKVLAKDYLAQHAEELNAAQDKLTKLKKKFGGLESINNIPNKKQNPLKGKTFGERLILGGNFQIYKGKPFGLDISPQLAYKLTPKFRLGIGGVYRTSFGNDDISLSPTSQSGGPAQSHGNGPARPHGRERSAYGFSAYLAHDVYKSFYAHGEFEKLHNRQQEAPDEKTKPQGNWHERAYLGIGKTYHISQKVKGNIMILYNVLNDKTNPYRKPWNVRFGFQIVKRKGIEE